MLEADQAMTQMALGGNNARFGGDDRVYAEFFLHPKRNRLKSEKQGRDIFEDVPYIKIMIPGDKDNIVERPVRDSDKQRFPKQWAAFQNSETQTQEGTPLTEWAGISRSIVEELKFFGVRTVEALAHMPDSQGQNFMGFNTLKQKAKAYLEDSKLMVPIANLNSENAELKQQLAELQAQMAALSAANAGGSDPEVSPPAPRRRGRRKKVISDAAAVQDDI